MTFHYHYRVMGVVFACGVIAAPAFAQRRDGSLLPQENSGNVVAVGCLLRGTDVRGGKKDKYVLARPKRGPVASVAEASCTAESGADALTIDNPEKGKITDAAIGRWVEISGRLERETNKDPDDLRELDVATFKVVPVVVPPRAATTSTGASSPVSSVARAPETAPASAPASAPAPRQLPKTASQRPAIAFAGALSLALGLVLCLFRLRRQD